MNVWGRFRRLVAVLIVGLAVMVSPVVAAADTGGAAGSGVDSQPGTVQGPDPSGGGGGDDGLVFAARYHLQRVVEILRLLVTADANGEAVLLAEFAAVRVRTLEQLDPNSPWFPRLATDIANFLRLAQERLVQAQAEGKPVDAAVQALEQAVGHLEELADRLAEAGLVPDGSGASSADDGQPGGEPGVNGDATVQEPAEAVEGALEVAEETRAVVAAVAAVDPTVVKELRAQGYGFGQIALLQAAAQRIAEATGEAVTIQQVADLVAQASADTGGRPGFGNRLKHVLARYGVQRRELKPGLLVRENAPAGDEEGQEDDQNETAPGGEGDGDANQGTDEANEAVDDANPGQGEPATVPDHPDSDSNVSSDEQAEDTGEQGAFGKASPAHQPARGAAEAEAQVSAALETGSGNGHGPGVSSEPRGGKGPGQGRAEDRRASSGQPPSKGDDREVPPQRPGNRGPDSQGHDRASRR